MKTTFVTYADNIYKVEDKIKKFNKKLAKYGREEVVQYSIGEPYAYKCMLDGYRIVVRLVEVEIDDVTVTLNAKHQIIAKIELPTKEDTVVTMINREDYKVEDFQHIKELSCDHCHSNRRRKKGFILKNLETGELLQIGATCMKDYTRDLSIMEKMRFQNNLYDEFLFDEETYMKSCFSSDSWLPIEDVIVYTNRVVDKDGCFIKAGDVMYSNEQSTKDKVEELSLKERNITDEELERVKEMFDTIQSCEIEEIMGKEFNIELLDLIKNRYCKRKQFGKAVWIHQLYHRIIEYKEPEVINTINEYVGEIGDKMEVELKSINNIWIETYYGMSCMNKFVDETGRIFVWWTTKEIDTDGEFKKMKFAIKSHNEYKEEKQTVITRAKIVK